MQGIASRNQALTISNFLGEFLALNLGLTMKRRNAFFVAMITLLLFSGCAGYQLGGTHPDGVKTVFMAPILNKTTEPAIEIQLTEILRQRIQFDGRLKLVIRPEDADAIVHVTLTDYRLTAVAYREDLKTTAEQYRMRITASSVLSDPKTGEELSKSSTYGETVFSFQSDLSSSKRNALPGALEELAKFISDDLTERW